ncbi:hypothetical protein HBH56_104160 [Parastagonospora nodorum]|uniref:Uncharacterized protein n=2 Tax=Phaeosphaeria nodorum (strain SN15 / ATCC MYA-4574 / FGSC 10173) TaxID=321614 RepID=A0A7U2FG64_PHANO|nr:hypothetical protein SNOG_10599 [Parastagonospora nodorum SN15]KAH3913526.1 hypothetical protein HBH56_104160 [Parastagonospora nodorum]EAT81993.1 hypothetical protein SNOG_10599 [Parastagonospora nodorum SN15]KAH3929506.1 hypothetical protein HBH54_126250 [Parastagonospora nodorum]KAH3975308.1 hypothetical protein HBH52_126600 [Parastagonospora nodorum]KAH4049315.1 hypothetical protein HBH49_145020 [Parastagonospora nodorum]
MKLSGIVGLAALAGIIEALPTVGSGSASIEARDAQCSPPGEHKCALMIWATVGMNGQGATVVDGSCKDIRAKAKYDTGKGKGFSADLTTTYGPHLYMGAAYIGVNNLDAVTYQYKGQSYTGKDCNKLSPNLFQCNFAC